VQLQIEAVHQTQRPELVFAQLAGKAATNLVAILRDTLVNEAVIEIVVAVHS
jgi:hypothetical protein